MSNAVLSIKSAFIHILRRKNGYTVYSNNTNESKCYSCPTGF